MIEIKACTQEEINQQFKLKQKELKRAVALSVAEVLEGKAEKAVFVVIKPQGIALRVEKKDYLTALEKNLDIFIEDENYEQAAIIKSWIAKVKENPDLIK